MSLFIPTQTNTMIYQDVFSCVPNDLIHSRYNSGLSFLFSPLDTIIFPLETKRFRIMIIPWHWIVKPLEYMQNGLQTKPIVLERETGAHNDRFGDSTREAGVIPQWRHQEKRSNGQTKVDKGTSRLFPFRFHV